jgi:uncharacterized YccA/Bax inhibitor family protein
MGSQGSRQVVESRNPVLSSRVFSAQAAADAGLLRAGDRTSQWDAPPLPARGMTVAGTARVSVLLLALILAAGVFGWNQVTEVVGITAEGERVVVGDYSGVWLFAPMILALVAVLAGTFKPKLAPVAAPIYAVAEGVFLGVISHAYDARYDGIVLQAIIATAAVFLVMAALYSTRIVRVTSKMVRVVTAATMGIAVVYLVGFVGSLFGVDLRFWDQAGPLGIGISLVIVAVAAFNLMLDFDFIERGSQQNLPKTYNWVAALGLTVTIVWLYLELLRLLSRLRD